ncbi:MAG: hypothetical protein KC643_13215 [Nitrospira sp.]|nr:hypothetical protein [Nitrospira sp.]
MNILIIKKMKKFSSTLVATIETTLKMIKKLLSKNCLPFYIARRIWEDWMMVALGGIIFYAQWEMSIATLGLLLSLPEVPQPFPSTGLFVGSFLCCSLACGLSITDLMGFTRVTRFSELKIGRKTGFYVASTGLILSIMLEMQVAFHPI